MGHIHALGLCRLQKHLALPIGADGAKAGGLGPQPPQEHGHVHGVSAGVGQPQLTVQIHAVISDAGKSFHGMRLRSAPVRPGLFSPSYHALPADARPGASFFD